MASQRITAAIRDALVKSAKDRRFKDERAALEKQQGEVDDVQSKSYKLNWEHAFSAKHRKILKSLPAGWLNTAGSVNVQVLDSVVVKLKFGMSKEMPNKFTGYESGISQVLTKDNPAIVARQEHIDAKEDLDRAKADLTTNETRLGNEVRAVIESVTTTGKLKEIWPQVVKLLPEQSQPKGSMLPAIQLDDLNTELGI